MDNLFEVPTVDVRERIPEDVIRALAHRIAEKFHPQRIILFGSYAYGVPRPESDVDFLVVIDEPEEKIDQALEIRKNLHVLFGLDLIVISPAKLNQRINWGDSFLRDIVDNGITLYESSDN
jgi:uncharacterized protein